MTSAATTPEGGEAVVAQTIVVPLDGSPFAERALPIARAVARRVGAQIVLVAAHWEEESDQRKAYLEEIATQQDDVATRVELIDEHPAARAIEHVVEGGPNRIVCMTSHGRGTFRWAVLGSVAEEVVRKVRKPALLVGPHCNASWPNDFRHMLVCVDGSSVADPVVPVATRWAKALGLDVRVASVIHPLDVEGATHPNPVLDPIVERFEADGVHAAAAVLRDSYTAGAIADFPRELPATLVAMNTHARGGMARIALGSIAMGVVSLAGVPLLLAPMPG